MFHFSAVVAGAVKTVLKYLILDKTSEPYIQNNAWCTA